MAYKSRDKMLAYYHRYNQQHKAERLEYCEQHKDEKREYDKQYQLLHKHKIKEQQKKYRVEHRRESYERGFKQRYGSIERYTEGMEKYDGWCAFACDRKAYLVHHMDGKNIFNSPKEEVNNDLSNLLPLCLGCHNWLHRKKHGYNYKEVHHATH